MKAVQVVEYGNPIDVVVVNDIDEPEVGPGEIRVAGSAASLNYGDIARARGGVATVQAEPPFTLGMDVCGVVEAAGSGAEQWLGRRVVAMAKSSFGGMAEKVTCTANGVFDAPPELDDADAAGFLLPFHTGFLGLHTRARVQPGETVMVVGAASSVGAAAVQLAAAAGAQVIALAGGEEKGEYCLGMGASSAIDYRQDDVYERVMEFTNNCGADVVFDLVGGDLTAVLWTCVAREGRYLPVGFNDDMEGGLSGRPLRMVSIGNFSVLGVMLSYSDPNPVMRKFGMNPFPVEQGPVVHSALCELITAGAIRPAAERRIAMSEVGAALDDHEQRRTRGRTVVDIAGVGRVTDTSLRPDRLLAEAVAATGLDDFGPPSYREGLDVLCDSLVAEAHLNDIGAATLPTSIGSALQNRLKLIDWVRTHPEVTGEAIDAPWIVIGIFRAGTTLLSYLLEKDERSRPLLRWEAADSTPPSTGDHRNDPRVEAQRAGSAMLDQINPQIRVVQSEEPDGPTECISVLNQDFKSLTWEALANVPAYGQWLRSVDHSSAYEYHRVVLQVLQSGGVRGRWSLKSPHHAMRLEALHATYPDARLVVMHRDPTVLCASVCSLISTLTGTFSDHDHAAYIARHWTQMLEDSIDGLDTFRAAHPDVKIHDVHYADLATDPIGTMERVYRAFGETLDGQALAAMTAHIESHPKGRFGRHGYDLVQFGLEEAELAERFAGYVARYEVPTESA